FSSSDAYLPLLANLYVKLHIPSHQSTRTHEAGEPCFTKTLTRLKHFRIIVIASWSSAAFCLKDAVATPSHQLNMKRKGIIPCSTTPINPSHPHLKQSIVARSNCARRALSQSEGVKRSLLTWLLAGWLSIVNILRLP